MPHIRNFLDCVRTRQQPNASIEIGFQAVRSLHLAYIAYHKKARGVLNADGKTASVYAALAQAQGSCNVCATRQLW